MKNIALIGFMGSGKTTISKALAKHTGWKLKDVDECIVEKNQMSIAKMFEMHGEEYFRDRETEVVKELAAEKDMIISCGGGSVLREENVEALKENGVIVLLTATPETIYERVKDSTQRPILNGNMNVEYIRELMEKRRERYENVADIMISTDGKKVDEIVADILNAIS